MNPANTRKFNAPATLACLCVLAFWAVGAIVIKFLAGFIDVWTQNLLRYLAACLFWLPLLVITTRKKGLERDIWRRAVLPAAVNIVMQSVAIAAYYYLNPGFVMLLMESSIVWIAGFSLVFFAEERALVKSKRFWLGIGLSVAGLIGVMLFKEDLAADRTMVGIVIALCAAAMWGLYTVTVKIAFKNIDSRRGFSVISIYTVIGLSVLAFVFGDPLACLRMSAWPWACIVISGILCIGISHVLYYAAIKRIGATIPAIILLSLPFAVLALSRIVFGEVLNGFQLVFGTILIVGAGFAIWAQQHLK
jgi:drug/metabolite transporter (DMT)-like permease